MYRAYCGNLDAKVTEETLETLCRDRAQVSPDNILLKRGYAFFDFPDQPSLDKVIDSLHGKLTSYRFFIVVVHFIGIPILSHLGGKNAPLSWGWIFYSKMAGRRSDGTYSTHFCSKYAIYEVITRFDDWHIMPDRTKNFMRGVW